MTINEKNAVLNYHENINIDVLPTNMFMFYHKLFSSELCVYEPDSESLCMCCRCSMAAARSCPISTLQLTLCMALRDWL